MQQLWQLADGAVDQRVPLRRRQLLGQQPAGRLDGNINGAAAHLGNRRLLGLGDAFQRLHLALPGIADFPGARYELLDGEAPIWPGLTVIPTPGHTAGHQSLVVETRQGRVVLAGQSFNLASEYAQARLSQELDHAGYGDPFGYPAWMDIVEALDPWRVLFAHDVASWERGPGVPPRG